MSSGLESTKVGDYVSEGRSAMRDVKIWKVSRVTATQIVTGDNKWRKSDGALIGDTSTWWRRRIQPVTQKDFIDARICAAQRQINNLKITAETLDAAEALIKLSAKTGSAAP